MFLGRKQNHEHINFITGILVQYTALSSVQKNNVYMLQCQTQLMVMEGYN